MHATRTPPTAAPYAQSKDRGRFSLFAGDPPLRELLRQRLWPEALYFGFPAYVYPLVVALLLFGPQVGRCTALHCTARQPAILHDRGKTTILHIFRR